MKQILQDLGSGETQLVEAPAPANKSGHCLIETRVSLISAGTERMLVSFGQGNLLEKALQQPEKVKQVLDKTRTDGISATYEAVRNKLSQPVPLGYCNVGIVHEPGGGVVNLKKGDRVVSNGPHADVVRVPVNLCAKIPANVDDESASFTVLASIGLQGVRLAQPTLGENFVVIGAGLIGLCTIQLLIANGCRVLAIDYDQQRLDLAKQFGADICNPDSGEEPLAYGLSLSSGKGVDGVIITASTKSSDPVSQAAKMSRKRGRIILVGVTGLELSREEFYEKELSFQVSCSYGPGRYDENYEEKGNDYPLGFVRWTEQRNFEAILDLLSSGKLNFKPMITHRYLFEEAIKAYSALTDDSSSLGIVLKYSRDDEPSKFSRQKTLIKDKQFNPAKPIVGFVGAGNYASRILIPAFKKAGAQLHSVSTSGGINSVVIGKKNAFSFATSDTDSLMKNPEINTIVIATQHNTHAQLAYQALAQGKNVFVEKPLAITLAQLETIESFIASEKSAPARLMVGFNRRFAPQVQKIKSLLESVHEPKSFIMTINAGYIPKEHWTQDVDAGGGRIIGEACHFIDLMRYLADSPIRSLVCSGMGEHPSVETTQDKVTITIHFEDGSFGTIHYFANGGSSFPKERIEIFANHAVLQLDNFRKLKAFNWKGFNKMNLLKQDKGQFACAQAFVRSISEGTASPIPVDEIIEVSRFSIEAAEQLRGKH